MESIRPVFFSVAQWDSTLQELGSSWKPVAGTVVRHVASAEWVPQMTWQGPASFRRF